jgi:hypothetical protein
MPWFTVKTFHRIRPTGRPQHRDSAYRPGLAAVEERIVLFQAKTADAAIRKGLAEARKYARTARAANVYGQVVVTEPLDFAEVFQMFESPIDGAEVFSATEVVSAGESPAFLIRRKVGESASSTTARLFIAARVSDELTKRLGEW